MFDHFCAYVNIVYLHIVGQNCWANTRRCEKKRECNAIIYDNDRNPRKVKKINTKTEGLGPKHTDGMTV